MLRAMKTILVLTNFSKKSENAANAALKIAISTKSEILLFYSVIHPETTPDIFKNSVEEYDLLHNEITTYFNELTGRLKRQLKERNAEEFKPPIRILRATGDLGMSVSEVVAANNIWMVIMGAKESDNGLSNFLFGSCPFKVINNVLCPVLLIPEKTDLDDIQKMAIVTDNISFDAETADFLTEFTKPYSPKLIMTQVASDSDNLVEVHAEGSNKTPGSSRPGLLNSLIRENIIKTDLEAFVNEDDVDILAIVHKKDGLFRQIFHSGFINTLLNYNQQAILIFPVK